MLDPRTGLMKRFVSSSSKWQYIGLKNWFWYMCSDYYSQACNTDIMYSAHPRYLFTFVVCFRFTGYVKSLHV